MSLGTIRVDETILPIVELRIARGGIFIVAELDGPSPRAEGHVRVFAADGTPVTENAVGGSSIAILPEIGKRDCYRFTYHLKVTSLTSGGPIR